MNTPGIRDKETRKISVWEEKILGNSVRTLVPAQPLVMIALLKLQGEQVYKSVSTGLASWLDWLAGWTGWEGPVDWEGTS